MLTQETTQLRNSCVWKTPRPRPNDFLRFFDRSF